MSNTTLVNAAFFHFAASQNPASRIGVLAFHPTTLVAELEDGSTVALRVNPDTMEVMNGVAPVQWHPRSEPEPASGQPLVLEAGKRYVLRNGLVTGAMKQSTAHSYHRWAARFEDPLWGGLHYFADDGSWTLPGDGESPYDAVAEYAEPEPASPPPLVLEAGKRYVLRNGEVTDPVRRSSVGLAQYIWGYDTGKGYRSFTRTGHYFAEHIDSLLDAVAEYVPPLELEEGKRYVLRDGRITSPLKRAGWDEDCSFHATVPRIGHPGTECVPWTGNGEALNQERLDRQLDIVAEYDSASAPPLAPEKGKRYVLRNGVVTGPVYRNPDRTTEFVWAASSDAPSVPRLTFTSAGRFWSGPCNCRWDVVSEYVEPEPPKLQLEEHKRYVLRDGTITGPAYRAPNVWILRLDGPYFGAHTYSDDGRWLPSGEDYPMDVVSEYVEPEPPKLKLEIGKYYTTGYGLKLGPLLAQLPVLGYVFRAPLPNTTGLWLEFTAEGKCRPRGRYGSETLDLVAEYVKPEPPKLRLEEGKCYRTRNGLVTGPVFRRSHSPGVWLCRFTCSKGLHTHSYTEDGRWGMDKGDSEYDLVAEHIPLKLEEGKCYRTRNGLITGPMTGHPHCKSFMWSCRFEGGHIAHAYTAEGGWSLAGLPHPLDIVAEYE